MISFTLLLSLGTIFIIFSSRSLAPPLMPPKPSPFMTLTKCLHLRMLEPYVLARGRMKGGLPSSMTKRMMAQDHTSAEQPR